MLDLTVNVWVFTILTIGSFILAVLSIVFVFFSLQQNRRMIEEASRPYVSIHLIQGFDQYYLRLHNYGKTSAQIVDFLCDTELNEANIGSNIIPFSNIVGSHITPGDSIVSAANFYRIAQVTDSLNFNLRYLSPVRKKLYFEKVTINLSAISRQEPTADSISESTVPVEQIHSLRDLANLRMNT